MTESECRSGAPTRAIENEKGNEQSSLDGFPGDLPDTRPSRNRMLPEDKPVHDWYRFVLSFPPHLVRDYIERFAIASGNVLLDPFCGTGTTLVEAKKLGLESIGIEAVPMSAFAAQTKLRWDVAPDDLSRDADRIVASAQSQIKASANSMLRTLPVDQANLLLKNSISPMPLHQSLILLPFKRLARPAPHICC